MKDTNMTSKNTSFSFIIAKLGTAIITGVLFLTTLSMVSHTVSGNPSTNHAQHTNGSQF